MEHSAIHPTAIIEDGAEIGKGTSVGAYSIIGSRVKLGRNNRVAAHALIEGNTTIGEDNSIFSFSAVGSQPQDLKYRGEDSQVIIGNRNLIREYVTIQPGTQGGGMLTRIGDDNLLMANSHIGHDSIIGNKNVLANSVAIAGHVIIENRVIVGGLSGVHQFCRVGELSFMAAGTVLTRDLPPFCLAHGNHAQLIGLNKIGMQRNNFSSEEIKAVEKIYKTLFRGKGLFKDRLAKIASDQIANYYSVCLLLSFVSNSQRGIVAARRRGEGA